MSNENRLNAHRKSNPWQPGMIFWLAVALALLGLPGGAVAQGFSISGIEVNQAIGVQKDGHLNFVAGKPTVVRVNLSDQVTVDENTSKVIAKIGDQEVGSLYPKSEKRPVQWVDFICEPTNNCGNWQAGTYSFEVNVNGVTTTTEAKYVFQERKILKVLALPIKARYGDSPMQVQVTKESNWKTMHKFMKSVFPVSTIEWEIRNELDLSDKKDENGNYKYDMASENGSGDALGELVQYLQRENRKGGKKYDMVVGFVAQNTGPHGRGQGIANPNKGVAIVVASDPDASATVAHEIAHLYEIGDTYDDAEGASFNCPVNPAPKNFRGMNWDQSQKNINCENGGERFSANSAAATVLATNHPYEVQGRGLLGKMACYMGSDAGGTLNYWTTPDAYDHLFNRLAPNPQGEQSLTTPQRVIDFYGEINAQGTVELGDWEDFTTTDTVADTTGQYQVVGLDASGATVASQAFDVSFFIRSNPVRTVEWAVFEGTMRFPQEVVKFQVKKDTQVLAEQTVSANAPVVSNVTPAAPATLSGEYTITWSAVDGDNDNMFYSVLFNPDVVKDPENWWILSDDLTNDDGNSWVEYFDELPGGEHAKIRVIANDGVLSGQADSAEFTVPFKEPEVYIEEMDTYSYESGWEVFLEADIYDVQDDMLTDDKIEWRSNLVPDKILGKGSLLVVEDLPVGEHTITVTGTNSAGLSSSDQITITVGNISSLYLEYPVPNGQNMTLSNSYGNVKATAVFPTDDVTKETYFELEALKTPSQAAPSGLVFAGQAFSLTAYQGLADAEEWDEVDFSAPSGIGVTVEYPASLPAGVNVNNLKLYRWDSNAGQWKDVAQDCTPTATYDRSAAGKLTVNICHLGKGNELALMASRISVIVPISILLIGD